MDVRRLQIMFPEKKGVNYSKLKLTPEGEYSITKRHDGIKILNKMGSMLKTIKDKSITELTGNVGGDTILFGIYFKKVDSIEFNPENFEALKNNVETFNLKNVTLHLGDSTKIYNWVSDVVYIDAPWGGPDYKSKENLDLYLGTRRLDLYVKKLIKENKPKFIFLKLPRNYNFERLESIKNVKQFQNFTIRTYNLVGLELE